MKHFHSFQMSRNGDEQTKRQEKKQEENGSYSVESSCKHFKTQNRLENISILAISISMSAALFSGGYFLGQQSRYEPPCQVGTRTVYPPLSEREMEEISGIRDKPEEVQMWIMQNVEYMPDVEQFNGSLCINGEGCDFWSPAAHFYRSKNEDCDGVLMFVHYALRKNGFGLFLRGKTFKGKKTNHAVYVYLEEGKYGVISIHKNEFRKPEYNTIDDLARSFAKGIYYESYNVLTLPSDEEILLYDFEAKNKVKWGEEVKF